MAIHNLATRATSLVLALELFFAPAAMARAANPLEVLRQPEPPADQTELEPDTLLDDGFTLTPEEEFGSSDPEETPESDPASDPKETPAEDPATDPAENPEDAPEAEEENTPSATRLSAVSPRDTDDGEWAYYFAVISPGIATSPNGTLADEELGEGQVDFELDSADRGSSWIYRSGTNKPLGMDEEGNYYLALPNVGRVPDKTFVGFYMLSTKPEGEWYSEDSSTASGRVRDWTVSADDVCLYDGEEGKNGITTCTLTEVDIEAYFEEGLTDDDVTDGTYSTFLKIPASFLEAYKASYHEDESDYGDFTDYYLPIAAKWVASSDASVTGFALTTQNTEGTSTPVAEVYTQDPRNDSDRNNHKLTLNNDWWDRNTNHEYYIMVNKDQATLDLTLTTAEPHYNFNVNEVGSAPVSITGTFNGKSLADLEVEGSVITVQATQSEDDENLNNSASNPARGLWTISNIPLTSVTEAKNKNDPYTTLTITVTSPDGQNFNTYTFHIERRTDPTASAGYGNTPVGMILRDKTGNWGSDAYSATIQKTAAIAYFKTYGTFSKDLPQPKDFGALYAGEYTRSAWSQVEDGLTNYDNSQAAVVAYLDTAFDDPGVSFVDSEGTPVWFGSTAPDDPYKVCVTRTIALRVADSLTPDLYTDSTAAQTVYYTVDSTGKRVMITEEGSQTLQNADGSDLVDLRGLNVLPGVYTMTYTFTDPTSGDEVEITRPLIILPIPGDVDMDGAVTIADAEQIDAITNPLITERVCNIKRGDLSGATAIRNGFQPVDGNTGKGVCDYFYPPLPANGLTTSVGSNYTQRTWSDLASTPSTQADGEGDTSALELRFLGRDTGSMASAGYTSNISGPWASATEGEAANVTVGDIFWVGVHLTAGDLAGQKVQSLALNLTYDSYYVEPVAVYEYNEGGSYSTTQEKWSNLTLYRYNQGSGADETLSIFAGTNAEQYSRAGSAMTRDYSQHYSKVIGTLAEKLSSDQRETRLKELCYNLRCLNPNSAVALKDGYLLVVPFRVIAQPANATQGTFVELSAGMRDITLVTTSASARAASSKTMAFSAQDAIFGSATENLRGAVDLTASTAAVTIPLGEDTTTATVLKNTLPGEKGKNARYDVEFKAQIMDNPTEAEVATINETLAPYGLSIQGGSGLITGTPTQATVTAAEKEKGIEFTVKDKVKYKIIIEKKDLPYAVTSVDSYYGETEFRGNGSDDLSFTVLASNLSQRDRTALGITTYDSKTTVSSKSLISQDAKPVLPGYTAGTFTACLSTETAAAAVTATTPARAAAYPIVTGRDPVARDYNFIRQDGPATSGLTVHPRPIWIDTISLDYAAYAQRSGDYTSAIYNTEGQKYQTFSLDEAQNGSVSLTYNDKITGGKYDNLTLTVGTTKVGTDKLTLTFSGQYTFNTADNDYNSSSSTEADKNWFHLSEPEESRSVTQIGSIVLTGESARNYKLVAQDCQNQSGCSVTGVVLRRGIVKIDIVQEPPALTTSNGLIAGDTITSDENLRVRVELSSETVGDYSYEYSGDDLAVWNLHYNWVTLEQKALGQTTKYDENHILVTQPDGTTQLVEFTDWSADANSITIMENGEPRTVNLTNWDPTIEGTSDDQDLLQYNGTTPVTADMDGMYICVVAKKFDSSTGDERYIKVYSEHSLKVRNRTLWLKPSAAARFYGEPNSAMTYTYSFDSLTIPDQTAMKAYIQAQGYTTPKGTKEELEGFLAYQYGDRFTAPTLTAATTKKSPGTLTEAELVTAATSAGGMDKYILLSGGSCPGYDFRYYRATEKDYSADFGYNFLQINRRPIIVDKIFTTVKGENGSELTDQNFATIYADTYDLKLTAQTLGEEEISFSAASKSDPAKSEISFKLPVDEATNALKTYYNGSGQDITASNMTLTGSAIYGGGDTEKLDADNLTLSYNVTFVPDVGYADWAGMATNYYSVEKLTKEDGTGTRPVEITDLILGGSAAGNYILVYEDTFHAERKAPAAAQSDNTHPNPTNPNTAHLIYGAGTVILRPIKSMELTGLGRMSYTYGETFALSQTGETGQRFKLTVSYDTYYGTNPPNVVSTTQEDVTYLTLSEDGSQNSFSNRGFTIYYCTPASTDAADIAAAQQAAIANKQTLKDTARLYPLIHSGAYLFVTGQRGAHDEMVSSSLSSIPLTVKKADLTLTGSAVHRFYGETASAADLSFTFPLSQLAEWDLARLNATQQAKPTGSAAELQAALAASSTDDGGYVAPSASQTAEATLQNASLNAYTSGNSAYASYDLPMAFSSGKTTVEYDNYVVTVAPGTLYVYPRPVFPSGIHTDEDNPIYTLFADTTVTSYTTQLTTNSNEGKYVIMKANQAHPQTLADGSPQSLPITGSPLCGSDQLSFNVSLAVDVNALKPSSSETDKTAQAVDATITTVLSSNTARNYNIIGGDVTAKCWGAMKLRSIGEIHIVNPPKMDYTYSEALDLTGLKVRIIYKTDTGEITRDEVVTYAGPDQFKEYGLYVNYYDSATLKSEDASQEARKDIVTKYKEAREGDHITIAPSHETSRYGSDFSANGKYLIVSAFQAGSDQPAATPKIIGAAQEGDFASWTASPKSIQISPLTLTYDLSAENKTYDGTTRTDGALTLTNVYQDSSVTDAIYVPIGADYEREGTTNFTALTSQVTNGKITFQTKNQPGYQYGTHLTFDFVNSNVHYVDYDLLPALSNTAYWRANQDFTSPTDSTKRWDSYPEISVLPVEVTNMNLLGPDAANYTWSTAKNTSGVTLTQHDTSVSLTTRNKTTAGQAAAPFATIRKATRFDVTALVKTQTLYASRRPALLLDAHSNALRFDFLPQSVLSETWWNNANTNENSADDYQSELHFEYALFYFDEDGTLRRWALDDGTGDYQDTLFFGGETVIPAQDPDYVPDPDRLPKADSGGNTTLTGQTYPWLAEDNGKSALGHEQGSGMTIFAAAYPGGEDMAEHYSWYYYLLKTARTALPRNTVFYPVIRLAETHNYSASAPVTADDSITPADLQKALNGTGSLDVSSMTSAARQAAEEHTANEALMAEGKWPEEEPSLISAPAVKTFTQRLDLTSVSTERNKEGDTQTDHLVETLEAVWFTDTQLFRESRELDGVVYNHPTRYYGYYWDKYLSTALKFEKEIPIDLSNGPFTVEYKDKEGKTQYLTVNQNHNLTLYVNTTANDGNTLRKITIVPSVLYARLGDAPFQLGLVTVPERPSDRRYTWTSSDSTVATVDETGLVTFRGVGECVITVTSKNNKTASVRVVVSAALALETYETPIFNFRYDQPWESLQEDGSFRGKDTLTRGQLALLLDKFLDPAGSWQATSELAYLDIREGDKYYDALCRLTGAGVVTGIPGGRFAPDQPATRAEFAAMLSRMLRLKLPTSVEAPAFTDASAQLTWAWNHIEALARTGVTYGVGSGAFAPDRPLTREEAAVILSRLLVTKLDETRSDLTTPTDVTPENWAYSAVLRAVNAVLE